VYNLVKPSLNGGKVEVFQKYAKVENDSELIIGLDFSNMYRHSQMLLLPTSIQLDKKTKKS
jgi:hypothetical protein